MTGLLKGKAAKRCPSMRKAPLSELRVLTMKLPLKRQHLDLQISDLVLGLPRHSPEEGPAVPHMTALPAAHKTPGEDTEALLV